MENLQLRDDLSNYHANIISYHSKKVNYNVYSKSQNNTLLAEFALQLLSLLPPSASVER